MSSSSKIQLTYFDFPGRGELARLIFTYGKVAFEDKRIQFQDFPALKPTLPCGQLPVLNVDGKVYTQSAAIARYAAKIAGLYPNDPLAALEADSVVDAVVDILLPIINAVWIEKDDTIQAQKFDDISNVTLPKLLGALEARAHTEGPFFDGEHATFADIYLFSLFHNTLRPLQDAKIKFSPQDYPKINSIVEKIHANPQIAAYLA